MEVFHSLFATRNVCKENFMKTFRKKNAKIGRGLAMLALLTMMGACASDSTAAGGAPGTTPDPNVGLGIGPAAVNLGAASTYVILAKSAITNTGASAITGDLGLSPAAASFVTGFSLVADASNIFSTSSLVTGKVFAADYAPPTPTNMTTATSDVLTAYTDAAGRAADDTNLGAGDISGMTLTAKTYKFTTGVIVGSNLTLSGGANDRWIFQVASDLFVASGVQIILSGGAQAKNVVWQVGGAANIASTAQFKGILLSATAITLNTGATLTGRLFAQTGVTLGANTITAP
jgi:hypothetical protein